MEKYSIYTRNNDFQYFETIKSNRNKRHSQGEFFVEGVRNINECLKNNWTVASVIYSDDLSGWASDILTSPNLKDAKFYYLKKDLMQSLSFKENKDDTSELIFIVRAKHENLNRVKLLQNSVILIFDRPSNKGNLGTVIRTCDSFGADVLMITGHAVDLYDSETIRASMGSFFKQKVISVPSFTELTEWIGTQKNIFPNMKIIGTSAKAENFVHNINHQEFEKNPVIIVIGNETTGLSKNFVSLCDLLLKIPMSKNSSASSLNVACAASVVLYEFTKSKNR